MNGVIKIIRQKNDDAIDFLIESGRFDEAEMFLDHKLRENPDSFPILLKLGYLDEKRGQNINAFDVVQRAENVAKTRRDKREARKSLERIKKNINGNVNIEKDTFTVKLNGNLRPLELEYSINQLARRKVLIDAILDNIDPKSKTVLEIECDVGIITKNLADYGFLAEGISEKMESIVLSMGFEYAEMFRMLGTPSPTYYQMSLDQDASRELEKCDVIMLLPANPQWYVDLGGEKAADIIEILSSRTKRQLFFYISSGFEDHPVEVIEEMLLSRLSKTDSSTAKPMLCFENELIGKLYCINQRQASEGNKYKIVPDGLQSIGSRSTIFNVDIDKCRSLNGFGFSKSGWNHFIALLEEVRENPKVAYEDSILFKFYERFQPRNRQEHFFGTKDDNNCLLNNGWTIFPWAETKNRMINSKLSPETREGGNHHYGPNSIEFGIREYKKLINTYNLIARFGYIPEIFPDGYVQGYFLKDGKDYRFIIHEGQHRMAAIGILGIEKIKCKYDPDYLPVVDIEKIDQWPQVKSGLYSKDLARKVFNYYFEESGRRKARKLGLI